MILTLDTLGERYGMLPSEVLARSTTLDIWVMDIALSYHDTQRKKAEKSPDMYDQDQLREVLERTKRNMGGQ